MLGGREMAGALASDEDGNDQYLPVLIYAIDA